MASRLERNRASLVLIPLAVCIGLTACTAPERHENRADYLELLVANLNAPSIGDVLCEFDSGEAGALTRLHHTIAVSGAENFGRLESHLEELGYSVATTSEAMAASREDSMVAVQLIEHPGADPELEEGLESRGCEIPENGAIVATITEQTPSAFQGE